MKQRGFSLYDVEEFLKKAGAERINENAVACLEREIEETVKDMVGEARLYANYAGRKALIRHSDLELIGTNGGRVLVYGNPTKKRAAVRRKARPFRRPTVDVIRAKVQP
ncbi:MAG: hypothetical protein M1158_04100 [Candidatus Marsarchaeota archaeon]|nr:hypothetical protein [Candidatus Marsarchaeota archaeon]